jgi:hypothetical protein
MPPASFRQRLAAVFPIGMLLAALPWLFYGPALAYCLYFPSQRPQALPLVVAGVAASLTLMAAVVLLTGGRSRDDVGGPGSR